jgi:hypothetical protein
MRAKRTLTVEFFNKKPRPSDDERCQKTASTGSSAAEVKATDASMLSQEQFSALAYRKYKKLVDAGKKDRWIYHQYEISPGIIVYRVIDSGHSKAGLNGLFSVAKKKIVCRHLAWRFLANPKGLVADVTREEQRKKIFSGLDDYDDSGAAKTAQKYYFSPCKLNKVDQVGSMLLSAVSDLQSGSIGCMILSSCSHAMAIRIWQKEGYWVMHFYDPNDPGYLRLVIRDVAELKYLRLTHLLDRKDIVDYYQDSMICGLSLYGKLTDTAARGDQVILVAEKDISDVRQRFAICKMSLQHGLYDFFSHHLMCALDMLSRVTKKSEVFPGGKANLKLLSSSDQKNDVVMDVLLQMPELLLDVTKVILQLNPDIFPDLYKYKILSYSSINVSGVEIARHKSSCVVMQELLSDEHVTAVKFMAVIMQVDDRKCSPRLKQMLLTVSCDSASYLRRCLLFEDYAMVDYYLMAIFQAAEMNRYRYDIVPLIRDISSGGVSIIYELLLSRRSNVAAGMIKIIVRYDKSLLFELLKPNEFERRKLAAMTHDELVSCRPFADALCEGLSDSGIASVFGCDTFLTSFLVKIDMATEIIDSKRPSL